MRIIIPSQDKNLNSLIAPKLARAPHFLIIDTKTKEFKAIVNPVAQVEKGAGVVSAEIITDQNIKAVIIVSLGQNALTIFESADIDIYQAQLDQTIEQILLDFDNQKLKKLKLE